MPGCSQQKERESKRAAASCQMLDSVLLAAKRKATNVTKHDPQPESRSEENEAAEVTGQVLGSSEPEVPISTEPRSAP